jgi:selenocysteine lyase/cysteine desulfurase
LPDKYEAGNHNAPGLFGLEAALEWLCGPRISKIHADELALRNLLIESLRAIPAVRLFAADGPTEQVVGVLSFTVNGFDPQEVAAILDHDFQIQVRSGLHCAPGAHRGLGTLNTGGTVRISLGPSTTNEDIDWLISSVQRLTGH